jgi:hypothetical protein
VSALMVYHHKAISGSITCNILSRVVEQLEVENVGRLGQ